MPSRRLLCIIALTLLTAPALAQPASRLAAAASRPATAAATLPAVRPSGVDVATVVEAEQIVRLRKSVEAGNDQIQAIKEKLTNPQGEFAQAEAEFSKLDAQMGALKKQRQEANDANKPQEVQAIDRQIADLLKPWDAARARFGLAVEERKALRDALVPLTRKLAIDTETLSRLLGTAAPAAGAVGLPGEAASTQSAATATPAIAAIPVPVPAPVTAVTAPQTVPGTQTAVAASQPAVPAAVATAKPVSQALVAARQDVETKKAEAQQAVEQLQTLKTTETTVAQTIASERKLMEMALKKQQQAQEDQKRLREEIRSAGNADPVHTNDLWSQLFAARERETRAAGDAKSIQDQLQDLEQDHSQVRAQQHSAAVEASAKQQEVQQAENKVRTLQNPFSPYNMAQWMLDHGPKLLAIIVGMLILHLLVRQFSNQIAGLVARNSSRGTFDDRRNRAQTLVSVFRQTANLVVFGGGTVMLLDEVGVPVVPLLGGAAVLGLAVAFGAQNLIRDYFAGFMVLIEDQYSVGDVVRIGNTSGLVEHITLRMTMLRDLEGTAHFIPHGTITTVSNLSHTWSQTKIDVAVAYKEDIDHVIEVLTQIAADMRNDPAYADSIVADAEMLGVDELADSAVIIRFVMRTRPLHQWPVRRELLRRIKNRFDELGIEIPFPHRTIYQHQAQDAPAYPEHSS